MRLPAALGKDACVGEGPGVALLLLAGINMADASTTLRERFLGIRYMDGPVGG
jgi:hypothetical protein